MIPTCAWQKVQFASGSGAKTDLSLNHCHVCLWPRTHLYLAGRGNLKLEFSLADSIKVI